jgi:DNA-directed RNA polymerase subunit RPC12/RpoP
MDRYTFHGPLSVEDVAQALIAEFNHGALRAQVLGDDEVSVIQITSTRHPTSGGRTALSIHLSKVEDGVQVQVGQQEWLGVAASLGKTALGALLRPASLLGRLDDLAVDINSLQLKDQVQETIERVAKVAGASFELSERLRRLTCEHCSTANPVGEPHCIACGAPLGPAQPIACLHCGSVATTEEVLCPECGKKLP